MKGFTLVELMLALLLLTTGLAATTFLFSRGIFATADAQEMEQAVALAQEKMEAIRGTAFSSIASESKAAVSGWSGVSREVMVTNTAMNLKQVVVTVYWNTVDGELSRSLTSHVANVSNNLT